MKPKIIYLLLCGLGVALPYSQFIPFLLEHGLDLRLFFEQLFATRVSGFFGLDVIVSAVVLCVLVVVEGRRADVRHRWAPILRPWPSAFRSGCRCFSTCARRPSNRARRSSDRGLPASSRSVSVWLETGDSHSGEPTGTCPRLRFVR